MYLEESTSDVSAVIYNMNTSDGAKKNHFMFTLSKSDDMMNEQTP